MSHHYSASQYNDAFKPERLLNYFAFTNTPNPYGVHAKCLPYRCGSTDFIACDNGWLYTHICRGPSSPWGDYATSIWEHKNVCLCVDQLRHPEKYAHPRHIFIAKEEKCHEREAQKVAKCINKSGWDKLSNPPVCMSDPCCPSSNCKDDLAFGLQMKLIICGNNPIERKRLMRELRRQQREYRKLIAGTRGRMKGRVPFCPQELKIVTWDGCKEREKFFGRVGACCKSGCSKKCKSWF